MIWARDDEIGREDWRDVEARTSSYHDAVVALVIRDTEGDEQVIRTTEGHPFFVATEAGMHLASTNATGHWVAASDLRAGDRLSLAGYRFGEIVSVRTEAEPGFKAYNLTVEGFHTFFIAETLDDEAVWVHNCNNSPPYSGKNPPINRNAQDRHAHNGSPDKSRFNSDVDMDALVSFAWTHGKPFFNNKGQIIGKRFNFSKSIGTKNGRQVSGVDARFSRNKGLHGFPTNK